MLHLVPATTREGFAFTACLLWQLPEKPFLDRHLDPKAQDVSSTGDRGSSYFPVISTIDLISQRQLINAHQIKYLIG